MSAASCSSATCRSSSPTTGPRCGRTGNIFCSTPPVPPDYSSATGQRWGNPLYDWERMRADGFRWWTIRLRTELQRFDLIRVDHFRGFEACWEIPAAAATAGDGGGG